ncbi:MAG: AAA family ATPase [Candidatus Eisenbacteria bacterium]
MIIRSIRVQSYGMLRDRVFEELARFVVVHGPNEAGKSTLRRFIQDLLFGYSPASLEGHPYAPRDESKMGGEIGIGYASGEEAVLRRRLLSSAVGALRLGERRSKIANQPVDGVDAITRSIYESIYSLDREDLEFPEATWGEVKDRIIGTGGVKGLRTAREVAEELENEGKKLWRSDQRGKTIEAALRERIRDLKGEIRRATERDSEIREKEEALSRIASEKEALEQEKTGIRVALTRAERLLPYRKRLEWIAENEETAGDLSKLAGFPEEIEGFFRPLDGRIESLAGRVEQERSDRDRFAEQMGRFTPELRDVLERADAIEESVEQVAVLRKERADLDDLRSARERKEGAIRERARALIEDPGAAFSLRSVPAHEARTRIHAYRAAREERGALEAAREAAGGLPPPPSLLPVLLAGAVGLALVAGAVLFPESGRRPLLLGAGGASLLVVLLLGWSILSARRRHAGASLEAERRKDAFEEARREEEARLAAVRDSLRDVGLLPSRMAEPDEGLAEDLADLGRALEEREEILRRVESTSGRIRTREAEVLSLCGELSLDVSEAGEATRRLRRVLEEAREAERLHEEAAKRIPELDARLRGLEEEIGRARSEKESMEGNLLALGAGDLAACIDSLETRREALRRAEDERRRIEEEGEDLDALAAEIANLSSTEGDARLSDEEKVRLEERRDEIELRLPEIAAASASLGKEIELLRGEPGASEIEGEKKALEEELEAVYIRHDRLALLARIVREADARFRAEHEPDIVARAGELFSFVSGGRYERLGLDPEEERIELLTPNAVEGIPATHPVSRGTLDQLFLCLRLALLDHLEAGGEPLPLFLDDVLYHWDDERRERGIEVLRRVAERRQVFFLTCNGALARRLAEAGAAFVTLPGPGPAEPPG